MTKKKTAKKTARRKAGAVDIAALAEVLQDHALGRAEMSATQVSVALALLKIFNAGGASAAGAEEKTLHEEALLALE